jgi:hypothetical protein
MSEKEKFNHPMEAVNYFDTEEDKSKSIVVNTDVKGEQEVYLDLEEEAKDEKESE